jgi:acetoin utilization protein AcuB
MTLIRSLMTPDPVTIKPTTTLAEAARLMSICGLRHLPVVDDEGQLVGLVSDRDLRGPLVETPNVPVPVSSDAVRAVMARDLITAQPEEDLGAVARRIVDRRISAVPVVDPDGALRGIVSYVDVLRRLADEADADARALELMDLR